VGALFEARARADAGEQAGAVLALTGEGCPDAALVREMLAPLVSERIALAGDALSLLPNAQAIRVRDLGPEYAIEMRDTQRLHSDPERNCAERARVAAVFIALNLRENAGGEAARDDSQKAPAPAASSAPSKPSSRAPDSVGATPAQSARWPLQIGIGAWASVQFAPEPRQVAPGGGASVWLQRAALRLTLRGELMGKVALPLTPAEPGGSAELWRIPLALSVGYVWHAARFALEPRLGLAVDLLRMRGLGVDRSEPALRANAGAELGLFGRVFLGPRLALFAGLAGSWFPRAYALRIEPTPRRAYSPKVWLAGQLGLEFMLR
jgi:hypothetical protein